MNIAEFEPPHGWRLVVQSAGVLAIVSCLAVIGGWTFVGSISPEKVQKRHVSKIQVEMAQLAIFGGSLVSALAGAITGLGFVAWVYKSYRNLNALRAQRERFTPTFAAIAFFIPCANLILALPILLDIWAGSDPAQTPGLYNSSKTRSPICIYLWFGCLLLGLAISVTTLPNYFRASDFEHLNQLAWPAVASGVLSIIQLSSLVFLVTEVTSLQAQRYGRVRNTVAAHPRVVSIPNFPEGEPWREPRTDEPVEQAAIPAAELASANDPEVEEPVNAKAKQKSPQSEHIVRLRWGAVAHLLAWGGLLVGYYLTVIALNYCKAHEIQLSAIMRLVVAITEYVQKFWFVWPFLFAIDVVMLFKLNRVRVLGPVWRFGFPIVAAILLIALCLALAATFESRPDLLSGGPANFFQQRLAMAGTLTSCITMT